MHVPHNIHVNVNPRSDLVVVGRDSSPGQIKLALLQILALALEADVSTRADQTAYDVARDMFPSKHAEAVRTYVDEGDLVGLATYLEHHGLAGRAP